jgi:hypothetical protein
MFLKIKIATIILPLTDITSLRLITLVKKYMTFHDPEMTFAFIILWLCMFLVRQCSERYASYITQAQYSTNNL